MKRFQFSFIDKEQLEVDLCNLKVKIDNIKHSSVLFRVYSEIMDAGLINSVCGMIEEMFPGAMINGCTTTANVDSGELAKGDIFIVCTLFELESTRVESYQIELEGKNAEEIKKMIGIGVKNNPWITCVEILSTMSIMSTQAFAECILELSRHVYIFGGGAINRQIDVGTTWVYSKNHEITDRGMVCVLYGGEDLHMYSKTIIGWRPLGKDFMVTKAKGNVLYELDGKPAFEAYSKYLKIDNNEVFLANSMEFPILCKNINGSEALRTGMVCNDDGSVNFASIVDNFVSARLTYGSQDNILIDANEAAKDMAEFEPEVLNAYSCFGRKNFLGDNCTIDIKPFGYLGDLAGFFTSGELATDEQGLFLHHNETLVVVGMREGEKTGLVKSFPKNKKANNVSLGSRLVNFIGEATKELQEANEQLEKLVTEVEEKRYEANLANRAKSDFLANMSHEIRTPINAILGFDTMILREARDEDILKYAFDIRDAGENLVSIINDILDLSKVESGKMELIPVKYELSSLINDVMNMIILKGDEKGLDVKLEIDEKIPAWLFGDDVRIRQIIVNLLNNAVKYTDKGSVILKVDGEKDGEDLLLHIAVTDTGRGIKEEDMEALFDKFRRIEENKNKHIEGTGLGISITVMLLNLMDSKLEVKSVYGEGSTFEFVLRQKIVQDEPIGDYEDRINNSSVDDKVEYDASFTAPDAKILVVDDNALNRKVVINLIKGICQNVEEADGGIPTLEKTMKNEYDLILLDHMMPDLDGISTFHKMRENPNNLNLKTPVIMLTANAISGAKEEYLNEGFEDFLAKPINPEKLEEIFEKYLPEDKVIHCDSTVKKNVVSTGSLPEIDGVVMSYALSKLVSEELVLDTMKTFSKGAIADIETLSSMKEAIASASDDEKAAKIYDYEVKVHAMKSNLAMIGALQLSGVAKALEFAAKDKKTDIILSLTDSFLKDYAIFKENLDVSLDLDDEGGNEEFDKDEFVQILDKMSNALNMMDIDTADECMEKIHAYCLPESISLKVAALDGFVTNIDLENTSAVCNEIKNLL